MTERELQDDDAALTPNPPQAGAPPTVPGDAPWGRPLPPQEDAPPAIPDPTPPPAAAPTPPWGRQATPLGGPHPAPDQEPTVVHQRWGHHPPGGQGEDFPPPVMRDDLPGVDRRRQTHPDAQPRVNGSRTAPPDVPAPQREPGPPPEPAGAPRSFSRPGWGQEPAARRPDADRWAHQPPPAPAASPGNWSYVDSIRTSELVPTRKIPPGRGWRRAVYRSTFGLLNLGRSPDERRLAELEAKIRSLLRGRYKIGVLGKGGTGKTTLAAGIGSIFAEVRQDDRVVAIDADPAFGKLGARIDPNARGSYWELAADDYLHTFADVRSRVGNNAAGLFVLAGESATARRRLLDPAIYREATARLDHHFTISIVDCGSMMDSPVTGEVLRDLDALVVVSSPWVDGASAAGQTLEWLANNGYTGLLHRTVVVLNDSDGHADKHTRQVLVEQFSSRGQVVIEVPFDAHLRPGGVIDVQTDIAKTTRRRLLEIAAAIAEHFPATTDGPRERR